MSSVTLSVPDDVLRDTRIFAASRNKSLSAVVTDQLRQLVASDVDYARIWEREFAKMDRGIAVVGPVIWTREDAHARQEAHQR